MNKNWTLSELSRGYDKPPEVILAILKHHGIKVHDAKEKDGERFATLPLFRSADDGLGDLFSDLTSFYDTTPSRTKQEFTAEVDINNIMRRFRASGGDITVLPMTTRRAMYGDFTSMPDSYHAALNFINDTKAEFMKLDADLRARFQNDPQLFLDFVSDPKNQDELVSLGLALPVESPPDAGKAVGDTEGKASKKPSVKPANADSGGEEGA